MPFENFINPPQYDFVSGDFISPTPDLGLGNYSFDNPGLNLGGLQTTSAGSGGGFLDGLGDLAGGIGDFVGDNWQDLTRFGLGALGMYGASQDRGALLDQQRISNEVAREQLALQRELGLGELAIRDRDMGLDENQFRLGEGLDNMASKAMGMQLLVNRGRMTPEQVNPWLNMMYTGRQQMFNEDPVIGQAYAGASPYEGQPLGVQASRPEMGQFFQGLDPMAQAQGMQGMSASTRPGLPQGMQPPGQDPMGYAGGGRIHPSIPEREGPRSRPVEELPVGSGALAQVIRLILDRNQKIQEEEDKALGTPRRAQGGLSYLSGGTPGQADTVDAKLSHGEYVFDADTVAALGDGNSEAGAKALDKMREKVRKHKRSAPVDKIPPKAKDAMSYLRSKS